MTAGADGGSLDAERVARILLSRGSVREAIALLRGAVARDREEEACAALLASVLANGPPESVPSSQALTLELVDRWIRRGMLVEALALLGGTPMGGDETGREWANLLGELLAPVPVDAEEALVEMHRQLLTGGASVALVLLEERARREPALPAWATRRLELLRWILLDNAASAEEGPELSGVAPNMLAVAVRSAVQRGSLKDVLEATRWIAKQHPSDPDPPALARAVETLLHEVEQHAEESGQQARTLPMFGRPAAAMQLRMGNLGQAAKVYRRLLEKDPEEAQVAELIDAIEAVLRAARGEPVAPFGASDDPWSAATERGDSGESAMDAFDDPASVTQVTVLPEEIVERERASAPAPSLSLSEVLGDEDDDGSTTQTPAAPALAERFLAEGRLYEAELIYRGLATSEPDQEEWTRRADAIRAIREGDEPGVVLVRAIRRVE